jgi:hypothetical protein
VPAFGVIFAVLGGELVLGEVGGVGADSGAQLVFGYVVPVADVEVDVATFWVGLGALGGTESAGTEASARAGVKVGGVAIEDRDVPVLEVEPDVSASAREVLPEGDLEGAIGDGFLDDERDPSRSFAAWGDGEIDTVRVAKGVFEGGPFGEVPVGLLKGDNSMSVYEGLEGPFLGYAAVSLSLGIAAVWGGGGAEEPIGVPRADAEEE